MARLIATASWRNLDLPGHDACRLLQRDTGWRIEGHAVFEQSGRPATLGYAVDCDLDWTTRSACVEGWVGADDILLRIEHTGDAWLLNGELQAEADGCLDLDLGFTPATNLIALRRLRPGPGTTAAIAAYLPFPELRLTRLEQTYRRTGPATLFYASPAYAYAAELTVDPVGFVTDYPGLWSGSVVKP